jgi:diacylglycerol kinase (ATP)
MFGLLGCLLVNGTKPKKYGGLRSALVLANPVAGGGRSRSVTKAIVKELTDAGLDSEVRFSDRPGHMTTLAREYCPRHDVCVSVGGDGTLAEILAGLREMPEFPVAPFPTGTANVLSKDVGLARTPRDLVRSILGGRTMRLDVSRVIGSDKKERTSFLVLGVGIDGIVIQDMDARRKGPISKLSYLAPIARTLLRYRAPRLHVEIDGVSTPGEFGFVLVSNCVHYAGHFVLDPTRDAGDGLWEVVMMRHGNIRSILAVALRGLMGGVEGRHCIIARGRKITIDAKEPVPFQIDGDAGTYTPVSLEVSSRQHRIVIPSPL